MCDACFVISNITVICEIREAKSNFPLSVLELIGMFFFFLHTPNVSRGKTLFSSRTFEWMWIKFGVSVYAAGGGSENCTVVSSSAQPPPYMDLERNPTG